MSKIIESIDYFPAGYCTSYTGLLFKKVKNKKMTFPAGVFLIKHRDKGYLLYDTGYHYDIKTKLRYGLYRLGTPVQMTEKDQILNLLKAKGIRPEDITHVMLSHLHYNLFIAADLCWGVDLLPYTKQMHLIPSLVQDNMADYIKGTELLEDILKDGTEVLVSHDPVERIERILYEKNNLS